jgi:hypothetical protein
LLDAAVLADSAGMEFSSWGESDVVDPHTPGTSEKLIMQLNSGSAASFSFRVLNQDGSIWLLLSGGGASITIADEASNRGKADYIGNYGEYSGGPTREETQVYTDAVLKQMFNSKAGIGEEVAEIFSFLLRDYRYVMERASKNKILKEKVDTVKEMIFDETNGVFNTEYWEEISKKQVRRKITLRP